MKALLYSSLFLVMGFYGCKKAGDKVFTSNNCTPSGKYFNRTVLDKCPGTFPADIPYYALQLNFKTIDSVEIHNGIERYKLPVISGEVKCQFRIPNASVKGDMYLSVANDSTIFLQDSAWTGIKSHSVFGKDKLAVRSDWNIETHINNCVIAGTYTITDKAGKTNPVYFLPNGQVSGIKPYLGYTLCYAGDCLEETAEKANTIEFMNDKGGKELFVFKKADGRRHIQFYKVGPTIPDIKGERSIGDLAFELRSEMEGG